MRNVLKAAVVFLLLLSVTGCPNGPTERDLQMGQALQDAVGMIGESTQIIVSTVSLSEVPHVMVADEVSLVGPNQISVNGWDCPQTASFLESADQNRSRAVSVVLWDESADQGYQISGNFRHKPPTGDPSIQAPRENAMKVDVHTIVAFGRGGHDDAALY